MNNIIDFPEIDYFGGCPRCGRNDGYRNIGSNHWFICHRHLTKWWVGSNLFSCWKEETQAEWFRNGCLLTRYRIVEPVESGRNHPNATTE